MNSATVTAAVVVAAINLAAALLGAERWYRGGSPRPFWLLLRVAQATALLLAVAVGVLVAAGHRASSSLFYLYAVLPVVIAFVAEQVRLAAAQTILDQRDLESAQAVGELPEDEQRLIVLAIVRREVGVMAVSAFVVAVLALRAAMTAKGF